MNWKWRVSHARGYRELGLFKEAGKELALIEPPHSEQTEVLAEHAALSQEMGAWQKLADTCRLLAGRHPDDPAWWVMWAYGTRRAESLTAAEKVLLTAEAIHGGNATIQFNLGCYACQLGNLPAAAIRVKRAIVLDPQFLALARTDGDLAPLRESGDCAWA